MLFAILGIVAVFVVVMAAIVGAEQHDKQRRKATGQPAKRYHDINDYDVTTVYTIKDR